MKMPQIWELPPDILQLHHGEVHTWRVWLDLSSHEIDTMQVTISEPEMDRAEKFHFLKDRNRFIAAHSYLRQILAKYLELEPEEIRYTYNEHGKPEFDSDFSQMRFNLSHSEFIGLIAVSKMSRIGIDIERIKQQVNIEEIAKRFFSSGETKKILSLSESERNEAFFRCWTQKEAYIKALGVGMLMSLNQFEVSFEPGIPPKIKHIDGDEGEAARWNMYHINPNEGFIGALVVEGKPTDVKLFQMSEWPGS